MKDARKFLEILHNLRMIFERESFHHQKQIAEMLLIIFLKRIQCHEWDLPRIKYLEDVIALATQPDNQR